MIGTILKLGLFIAIVLIGLNIFAPKTYESTITKLSEITGIEKEKIDTNVEKATTLSIQGAEKLTQIAKEKIEESKEVDK